ncbi:TIR domain-containing protein [Thermodesulfovibrio sp. 3907-1M]|uniref:TIR domain-containing protein n=1 Tax=Thermodesulfovibrio autotrophicus TaxID=3118333 RepID=A0AAU8GWK1_9BACT
MYEYGNEVLLSSSNVGEIIQQATYRKPASVFEKFYRVLKALNNLEEYYMEPISPRSLCRSYEDSISILFENEFKNCLDFSDTVLNKVLIPYLAAMSYSITDGEVINLIKDGLKPLGYVKAERGIFNNSPVKPEYIQITPKGYEKIEELRKELELETNKVFVAMPFKEDDKELQEIYQTIQDVLENLGYSLIRVDKIDYTGYIIDKIMSEIKESRFVICVLTPEKGREDPNLNVMFEFGYAAGLNKGIIPLCNEIFKDKLPFDIKQFNTIFYENKEELKERLTNRIRNIYGKRV